MPVQQATDSGQLYNIIEKGINKVHEIKAHKIIQKHRGKNADRQQLLCMQKKKKKAVSVKISSGNTQMQHLQFGHLCDPLDFKKLQSFLLSAMHGSIPAALYV